MPLWQSVFFDAGNGFAELRHVKPDRLAYAYGTGIQIISPVGPIRLDYARRLKTDRYDLGDRWHFTILYAF
jgi:outer membrane protein assembly factor BamA